ncbi:MAG: DUF3048 domain-containing protein [Nocardiopsaceae bacterium]|nr:DUF3048 domain-containing protein [Nocardiopsaceae bacterium]
MTGLPASSAAAARPAVALLVGGTAPQGLDSADVVFQEATAPVRYIAVYQSRSAANVGPMTGTQPADRTVLPVLHPVVGYNGAVTNYLIKVFDKTHITDAGFGHDPALYPNGPAGPTTSTQAIAGAGSKDTAPPPLFTYRGTGSGGTTLAAHGQWRPATASLTIPGLGAQRWTFDSHTDRWTLASGGPGVQVSNLVIQTVRYSTDVLNAKHGTSVPVLDLTGSGKAEVLSGSVRGGSGGTAASGTWSRLHPGQVTNYFDSAGQPLTFQPGPTWVILAPTGTQVSTSS